ncbi:hypothetical protein ACF0H5_024552 [Mactra antiquata]
MSVVNCTFGPYLPFGVHNRALLHKCPAGGYSKIRCRPDFNLNNRDCGPGFNCVRKSGLYELDPLFCGVCCPLKRQCPNGYIRGPFCDYNNLCPRGFSCNNGVCCKTRKSKQFCPMGSQVGQRCSIEFPCKLGYICINGVCCSIQKFKPNCPESYFPLKDVTCSMTSQCPGQSICYKHMCCQHEKEKITPDIQVTAPRKHPLPNDNHQEPITPPSSHGKPHESIHLPSARGDGSKVPSPDVSVPSITSVDTPGILDTQSTDINVNRDLKVKSCPGMLRKVKDFTCDHLLGCPGNSQCISGICCQKTAPVAREFYIVPTVKPTTKPIVKTTKRPPTLSPAKSPFKIPTTHPQSVNVVITVPPSTKSPVSIIKQPKPTTPSLIPKLPSTWPIFNPNPRPTFPPVTPPRLTFNPVPVITTKPATIRPTPIWTRPVVTFNPVTPSTSKPISYIPPSKATPTFLPPIIIPTQPGITPPPYRTIQTPPPINMQQNHFTNPPTIPPTVPDLMPPIMSNIPPNIPHLSPYVPTEPAPPPIPLFPDVSRPITHIQTIHNSSSSTLPPFVTPKAPIGQPSFLTTPTAITNQSYPPTFPPSITSKVPIGQPNIQVTPTMNPFVPLLSTMLPKQTKATIPPVVPLYKPDSVSTRPTTVNYNVTPPPILPPSSLRPYPGTFTPINITVPPYPFPPGVVSTSYSWWGMSSTPPIGAGMTTLFNQPKNVTNLLINTTPGGVTNPVSRQTTPRGVTNPVLRQTTLRAVTKLIPRQTTLRGVTKPIPRQTTPRGVTKPIPSQTMPPNDVTNLISRQTTPRGVTKPIPRQTTPRGVTKPIPSQTMPPNDVTNLISRQTTPRGVTKPIPRQTTPRGVVYPAPTIGSTVQLISTSRNKTPYTLTPTFSKFPSFQTTTQRQIPTKTFPTQSNKHNFTTSHPNKHKNIKHSTSPQPVYPNTMSYILETTTSYHGSITGSETTTLSTSKQPLVPGCPPGNISIPGLSCNEIYKCPAGSQCTNGICCLSYDTVKVPACPVDFLSANPCPSPRKPDQCTVDMDCGPFMICCLTSCDRRVCKPIVSPKPSKPRK